jgi:hypothetical protein
MVPANLQQHLHLNHVHCKYKITACFKHECDKMKYSQTNPSFVIKGQNANVCEASYTMSYHIAQCGETHMTSENVNIILRIVDMGLCA